ncbi:MAG: four helix bundle protein [Anaerolineales bacterium]|nr:four helix bundle protein [Anaerolineales bacterium]MCB9146792.1 four helix bundle protein [Anaerolineales bacterium]
MKYVEWQASVPDEIKGDSLWRLEVYRLALFSADISWQDALALNKTPLTRDLADQLYRAVCSISANIAEGYSRSTGKDRARFLEYSLGSAREARDWYFKSHHTLKEDVIKHRIGLLTQIIKMLSILTPNQRQKGIREEQSEYVTQSSSFNLDSETPLP